MAIRYSSTNLYVQAKEAEKAGEADTAIGLYKKALKNNPVDDLAYNRLMVQYRRKKDYRHEMEVIEAAIGSHVQQAHENQQLWVKKNKKTARTAKALAQSLGLVDKKGLPAVESRQLDTWQKRLEGLRRKLKSSRSKMQK